RAGRTKYGPAAGNTDLREAVAATLAAGGLAGLTADCTIITPGAKGTLYLALQVILSPGDEVIVPTPCWLSYPKMIQACGGKPVFVPTSASDGYRISPGAVERAITPKTKAMILNSPGNPTGAVQPDDVQRELGRIATEHRIGVISDEIYEHLTYAPATFRSFSALAPEARDLTLIVNGVSKAYAMTGWRIGYGAGPKAWVQRMIRLQSHALSGPPDITQAAALAAMTNVSDDLERMRKTFEERRDVMHAALTSIPDLTCPLPEGAFYMFPDVSAYLGARHAGKPITDTPTLAALLMEHAQAAVVPGDTFEAPTAVRFSYACSTDHIRRGVARVAMFLATLDRS
ncbi:MAG: pyridoxal phosphate-dependent aminotransferase, partial [Planctomycetota bacterium]|nr:pyridoxal phosphate-dependent aminotransferase [Planctomycetota bacterium]